MAKKQRIYFGKAYSYKVNRGSKTVDLYLDPPEADRLAVALLKYTAETFQAVQSGVELDDVPPVEITIHDGKKTREGKFVVTVTHRAALS